MNLHRLAPLCFLVAALAGCGDKSSGGAVSTPPPPDLELRSSLLKAAPGGRRAIVGAVRNNTPDTMQYAQVEFNLYDKGGHSLGTALAKTRALGPGRTWNYAAPVFTKRAVSFKVDDVTGY